MQDQSVVREIILEHARSTKNGLFPAHHTHAASRANPTCGDSVEIRLRIANGAIGEMGYRVRGCAVCSASASLMTDAVAGLSCTEAAAAAAIFASYVTGEEPELPAALSSLEVFAHLRTNPTRRRCALLPWNALSTALAGAPGTDTND
ncbi:MAG: SUF system NifU family Fe-S cluster assembly protein [Spirochaetales bacterium]|nr:SUF system NifU family Fe-S cluster assembly protein [Spirochaetales bacterium]